jgi:hypothetical protein
VQRSPVLTIGERCAPISRQDANGSPRAGSTRRSRREGWSGEEPARYLHLAPRTGHVGRMRDEGAGQEPQRTPAPRLFREDDDSHSAVDGRQVLLPEQEAVLPPVDLVQQGHVADVERRHEVPEGPHFVPTSEDLCDVP